MKSVSGSATTLLASGNVGLATLIHIAFSSPIYLTTANMSLTWAGNTYLGAGGFGSISGIVDASGEVQGISYELFGSTTNINLALDSADVVAGTPITIRTAIVDLSTFTVADAPVEWSGYLDTMGMVEQMERLVISGTAESKAVDLLRSSPSTYSDGDQQQNYPGDRAFEYVVAQERQPVVWPAREWFMK